MTPRRIGDGSVTGAWRSNWRAASFAIALTTAGLLVPTQASAQISCRPDADGVQVCTNEVRATRMTHAARSRPAARQPAPQVRPRRDAVSATRSATVERTHLEGIVQQTALQYGLDPLLVRAVIRIESAWDPSAVSSKDAMGLMQLIPATAQRFNVQDVFDPVDNVQGGVRYLAALLSRYHGDVPKALAAYYSGEHAVDHAGGVPSDATVRAYVRQVTRLYRAETSGDSFTAVAIRSFIDAEGHVVYTNE